MHKSIEELIKNYENNIRIQIIYAYSHNSNEQNDAIQILIAQYLTYGPQKSFDIYADWYDKGKNNTNDFAQKHPADFHNDDVAKIFESHRLWCEKGRITATPSFFVDGFKLPQWYQIKDLKYFLSI